MNSGGDHKLSVNLNAATGNAVYFFSAMLPSLADPQKLVTFAPALFARLERVQAQKKELEAGSDSLAISDRTPILKIISELQMLQQVLEWVRNCDLESNP